MIEEADARRKRICIVATVPYAIRVFMRAHIDVLKLDYDVTIVTNGAVDDLAELLGSHVSFLVLRIERKVSIKNDFLALLKLWNLFKREGFDIVHSITPKAGLLAMLAARLAGVPRRVHTFTGQVWSTRKGFYRLLLKSLDKVLAMNATRLLADSPSQRLFLIDNRVVKASAIDVLAEGSFAGVDLRRFKNCTKARQQIRADNEIPADAIVFLFLGRLTREKGLVDLSRAFAIAAKDNTNLHLVVVGPDEENLDSEFSALARRLPGRVHRFGFAERPERFMAAADVFCLPSYREGFGTGLIEAAAVGLPAIASRIYGITDAVEDGVTGILHHPTSDREIAEAMSLLACNAGLRRRLGEAARERVINKFSEARLTRAFAEFYRDMLSAAQD